jgi:transcriptional regulator with PAS, ATPase and Fis domain
MGLKEKMLDRMARGGKFLDAMRVARGRVIGAALKKHKGDVYQAAIDLGITPAYLYLVLKEEFPKGALAKYKKKGRAKP